MKSLQSIQQLSVYLILQFLFIYTKESNGEICKQFMIQDKKNDDFCECLPDYLYYLATDSCYEPYRQGPCPIEHYLLIPDNEFTAICAKNPCLEDGLVPFEGNCYPLGTTGPPCDDSFSLRVENFFFELACFNNDYFTTTTPSVLTTDQGEYSKTYIGEPRAIVGAPRKICPKGKKRTVLGICKTAFN